MTRSEKGSATLHSLFAAVLLITALTAATLWSAISTARHKLATAADLTALSAAQSLPNSSVTTPDVTVPTATSFATTGTAARGASGSDSDAQAGVASGSATPCAVAARIAAIHKVHMTACLPTPTSVTIEVSLQLDLPFAKPNLTATSRAGPV